MEDYLLGVVGGEMPPSWEMEALKAQAVAARTYAASRRREAAARGADFDVWDDTRSQVYAGMPGGAYASRIEEAVRSTAGEVLVWNGELLTAYFHSTCGGHTESAARVFGVASCEPLSGVGCTTCGDSTAFEWEAAVEAADLEEALGVGPLKSIRGLDPGPSGRCLRVEVQGETGRREMKGSALRAAVGYGILRSTAFEAEVADGEIRFRGRGFGHGVGLCQWGARGMAKTGATYIEILNHYYPGALVLQRAVLE
jgi:stage II sporulation protein D